MSDGIRLRPRADRAGQWIAGAMIVVRDVTRPIPVGPLSPKCMICGVIHDVKTYHLQLDQDGHTIVSATIWEKLQRLAHNGGFEKANVVSAPPDQHIGLEPVVRPLTITPVPKLSGALRGDH